MKITIGRDALTEVITWTARALPQRPSTPVLAGLLLDADDDTLTISAFDYDTSARAGVPTYVAEPGKVLIPGRVLAEIVKALPRKPDVELNLSGTEVGIRCGPAEFGLPTMPVQDYPSLPEMPDPIGTITPEALRQAVAQVAAAASKDDTIPMLTGVRLDIDSDTLTFAATDRYRIAAATIGWEPDQPPIRAGALIPARILHDLARGLGTGAVALRLSDNMAAFTCEGRRTTTRLLDEQFIDYQARLGTDYPIWAEAEVGPLVEAVKRVVLVADRHTPVRLSFTKGQVLVEGGGGDIGRGAEAVDAELDGADIQIAFMPHYLLDGLAGVQTSRARIGMTKPVAPALITATGDEAYRYLVMAIRLSS